MNARRPPALSADFSRLRYISARINPRAGVLSALALFALVLAACAPAAPTLPTTPIVQTQPVSGTPAPLPTQPPPATSTPIVAPTASPPATQPPVIASPTPVVEARLLELEWPPQMRLGDSDVVRLSLIPSKDGYVVTTEFPEHQTVTNTVRVERPGGYELSAVARLDGVGFVISPQEEQARGLPIGEVVTWRWTLSPRAPGQQRLNLGLLLRWTPSPGASGPFRESEVFSKSLDVRVASFFGLTQAQALTTGLIGLIFGGSLSLAALTYRVRLPRAILQAFTPNASLVVEPHPTINLSPRDRSLLQVLFRRYARVVVETEFRSGYSGARTFLALPIRADGRADAHTIVKIGERESIRREFENYEAFVKDTLPPITARIQEPPVILPSPVARTLSGAERSRRAALRYTFIAEPGRKPVSLRESLIANPDPSLLGKLLDTFGPNWWMQRRAYTFRLAQEYDRMLPAHYVLEPVESRRGNILDGHSPPSAVNLGLGDCVTPRRFPVAEPRADGRSWTLAGKPSPGQPPLRMRWLSPRLPNHTAGEVVATRETLLRETVSGLDLLGLPDPLARLPALLNENVIGTQSTIHGDLNLENILVGPGGFVWLIDFAQTRDGHPLYDFAHLEAEIIAHVLAPYLSPADYLTFLQTNFISNRQFPISNLQSPTANFHSLISMLHAIASRCLFNPSQPREYHLALYLACLGALKFPNLTPRQKHFLYLTAAYFSQSL